MPQPTTDTLSRPLRDLRVSVTDRCNFRCRYCMPREVFGHGYNFLPRADILSFEEIARIARAFISLGVEKIRLTGGEPLLRRDIAVLVSQISAIPGLRDLALTTNGSLLPKMARDLRDAGLRRVTVSLDSLDDAVFHAMTDSAFSVADVLAGIDAALAAGFAPVKINMVVRRGVNEDSIPAMARHFAGPQFVLRFIEYMDVGSTNGWRMADVVPAAEIRDRIGEPLTPLPASAPGETALRFRTASGGEVGIIASVTRPFCRSCTRARLTADGRLYTCLFAKDGHDLRGIIRTHAGDAPLIREIRRIWTRRSDRYSEIRTAETSRQPKAEMSLLGG